MATNVKELRQEHAELSNEIDQTSELMRQMLDNPAGKDVEGNRVFTDEQEDQYQELEEALGENRAKLASIDKQIKRYDVISDAEKTIKAMRVGSDGSGDDYQFDAPAKQPRYFKNLGEQLQAIMRMATGNATEKEASWLRGMNAAALGAGEAIGSDGGFLVQQDFAAEILTKMHEMGQILQRVRTTSVSGNGIKIRGVNETSRATGSRWGGVQGYWVDEGTAPTASLPQFNLIELSLKKVAALGYATDELMQDTAAMTTVFTQAFAEELTWLVEDSIINGTGAGRPAGILNAAATVSVAKETGQVANTVVFENIINMWARMWARSRPNSAWYINQDIEPQLMAMSLAVGTGGVPVYLPAGGLSQSPFATLMGRPVIPVEYCATLGTVGDIILADLSQYMLIDKNGVQQDTSIHVRFTTDETAFRALYRVDGQSLWNSALTPANGSNTQSPFITLATRS